MSILPVHVRIHDFIYEIYTVSIKYRIVDLSLPANRGVTVQLNFVLSGF